VSSGSAPFSAFPSALVALAMLWIPVRHSFADEIYKSVDAQGHVVYSDRATSAKAQKSAVNVIQSDPAEAARAARETSILKAEEKERKRTEADQNRSRAQEAQEKRAACEQARNRYYSVKDANILYKLDAQGNRVFYTDAEGDARKEQYRQAMVAACGK
jgi:hypothetical protein